MTTLHLAPLLNSTPRLLEGRLSLDRFNVQLPSIHGGSLAAPGSNSCYKLASASRVHQLGFATRNVDARFTSSQLSNQSSGRIVKTVDRRTDLKNRPPAFPWGKRGVQKVLFDCPWIPGSFKKQLCILVAVIYLRWRLSRKLPSGEAWPLVKTSPLDTTGRSRKISISAERRGRADRKTNQEIKRHLDAFIRDRIIGKLEEGRSVTSVAAEFGIAHSIVSRLWRQFQTTGTAIRGFSSGRPRETTPADDRYIVLQARRNRRQTAGEIARHTTQATGRPISRFTVARRLHGGGLFARRPVRCVPLTPAHRRRRSLWCREHRNWRDN
ncbi:transposable element Tcb1 transposase [Trichonephila clavipes]|nr:transposable element Tcb1 transposase [Trichonephila clavipes]